LIGCGDTPSRAHLLGLNPQGRFMEIYFSVVQRKVVAPNDFTDLAQVDQRLMAFQERYNATARPFGWKFTRNDLEELLARIEGHEQQHTDAPTIRQAA
jgi:hypothetical protein